MRGLLRATAVAGVVLLPFASVVGAQRPPAESAGSTSEGLVGLWHFEEGLGGRAADASPNKNHGSIQGRASWVTGVSGKALYFNGVDTFVLIPHSESLDLKNATIEAWLYVENLGGGIEFCDGASWEDLRLGLHLCMGTGSDGRMWFTHSDGTSVIKTPGPAMPMRQWCHVAVTCDGQNKRIYLNGALAATAAQKVPPVTGGVNLRIGQSPGLSPPHFHGAIDEVAVYCRALSADEIAAHAKRYTPAAQRPAAVETTSNYVEPVRFASVALPAPLSAKLVDDAQASEGKALELHGDKKKSGTDRITVNFPKAESAGRYVLKLRMTARDMYDLGKAWRVQIQAGDDIVGWDVLHGYHFKEAKGYRDFDVPFELGQSGLQPVVSMFWVGEDASKPVVRIDRVEAVRAGDLPALQITKVWPDKIRYLENQDGTVTVTCRNTTGGDLQGALKVELVHDLEGPKPIGEQTVSLAAGASKQINVPLRHGGGRFGYEVRATASVNRKVVDTASEYFCVTNNPNEVATHHGRFGNWEFDRKNWRKGLPAPSAEAIIGWMIAGQWDAHKRNIPWIIRYWLNLTPSDEDLAECAAQARDAYVTWFEVYSWSQGGLVDMDPKEAVWVCGDDCHWLYSKRQIAGQVAAMKKHGIGVATYILPFGQGLPALDLLRERPDWFCTSAETSDFVGYDVAAIKKVRDFRKRLEAAPKSQWPRFQAEAHSMPTLPYIKPNFARREVLDYAVDRLAESIRTFGWDGIRWDCGNLETGSMYGRWKPFLDFYGKPLCESPDEMVAQTVENLRYFRARIWKERPNFYFGLNYGGVFPTLYPKLTEAFMRDGGWLLDEETRRGSWRDSAYRFWDKYYEYLSDRGELMTSNGGHYNPYGLHIVVPGTFHAAHLYHMILGIAGHGHPEFYLRSKVFPIGDTAQFAVRFGRYLFDNAYRRVDEPEGFVQVVSSRPLWWKKSVLRKRKEGRQSWVVHLINPPVGKAIEDNVKSDLAPPVREIAVSIRVPNGPKKAHAWALTSESWKTGRRPVTKAVPLELRRQGNRVTVNIPEILFWKVVVFEFE